MQLQEKLHLTYCTNIHPGQDWKSTFESIQKHVPGIKKEVSSNQAFGLGLRLSNKASEELEHGSNMSDFKSWLVFQPLLLPINIGIKVKRKLKKHLK